MNNTSVASSSSGGDRSFFYCLLAILIWLPLPLASNRIWAENLLLICVLCLSTAYLVRYIKYGFELSPVIKRAWFAFVFLGTFLCWQVGQLLFLPINDSFQQYNSFLLSLSYVLIFTLSLQLINSQKRIQLCAWVLVLSALAQALYGSFMNLSGVEYLFFVPKDSYFNVNTGTFINRNSQAGYLVMCVSVGIGLMLSTLAGTPAKSIREHGRRWMQAILSRKIVLRLSLVMIVAGLVMTHSRMGNSSFFASLMIISPIALLLSRFNKRIRNKGSLKGMLLLLLSLIIIDVAVVGTFFGVDKVAQRLEATAIDKETRDEIVTDAIPLLANNYVAGLGGGTFYTTFPEHRSFETGHAFYDLAHNDYLQFALEFGLIGFVPLFLLCIWVFYLGLATQVKRGDRLLRGMGFGAAMSVLAMGIHSTVDFNLQMPANAGTFMVVLALGLIGYYFPSQGKRKRRRAG